MEKMIDIIRFLAGIVEENTHSYQSDFDYDRKRLQDAEWEPSQEDRTFLWMSRPCGTHCVLESEVFMRGTGAHSIWTHYEYEADQIRAFRVVVAPIQTVKMAFEDGESYELTYEDYRRRIYHLFDTHGRIETYCYLPENEQELACVLQTERAVSVARKRPRRPRKPPTR